VVTLLLPWSKLLSRSCERKGSVEEERVRISMETYCGHILWVRMIAFELDSRKLGFQVEAESLVCGPAESASRIKSGKDDQLVWYKSKCFGWITALLKRSKSMLNLTIKEEGSQRVAT
jgi:hypothetical protein